MPTTSIAEWNPATPEEIWATLDRVAKYHEETAQLQREHQQRWAEYDRRMEEEAKRREENEQAEAKRREEWAIFDKKWQESLEKWDKADRQLKEVKTEVGGMSNTFGEMVEHLVVPGIEERLGDLGFRFDEISPRRRIKDKNGNTEIEIDLVLENSETIVAVEVKGKVRARDIKEYCTKSLETLRKILDQRKDERKLLGVMAGAVFGMEQKRMAREAGLFVIVQTGDTMKLEIPKGFKPREW